jgi:hypothetical protein
MEGGDTATGKLATADGRGWWALVGIRDREGEADAGDVAAGGISDCC